MRRHSFASKTLTKSTWARLVAACLLAATCLLAPPVQADDRDLLRQSSGEPFVFILFDTSGSMHWTPQCTQESFDRGDCQPLCPSGDCYALRNGDDPASKFYQAKEALHEVLQSVEGVQFGFATYNQDDLWVRSKHWQYAFAATEPDGTTANQGIQLDSLRRYPTAGALENFGWGWSCDNGTNSSIWARGCYAEYPADLDDEWEVSRVQLLPKHCSVQQCTRTVYIRDDQDDKTYRVRYWQDDKDNWPYGAAKYRSKLRIDRCDNDDCSSRTFKDEKHVYYDLVDEFIAWDNGARRNADEMGFFSQSQAADGSAGNTCAGIDDNADTGSDKYPDSSSDYNLRWPTDTSDPRNDTDDDGSNDVDHFDFGDLIPLDWNDDQKTDILARLAPGSRDGEPYFGVSGYFRDDRRGECSDDDSVCYKDTDCSGSAVCENREGVLRLKDDSQRPLISDGATPLGNSIKDFRTWYTGCAHGACPNATGWEDLAAAQDPSWACRKKYLLIITDGDETCSGPDACSGTAGLKAQSSVNTFVVAFGVQNNSGNRLTCMAANGGTGEPIYPQNKQELVAALTQIFNDIRIEARSFASASVPTVQNETSDKIYLSSFTPLPNLSVWPGRIDSYREPLPLNDDDTPYLPPPPGSGEPCTRCCEDAGLQASCHLWNAGEVLVGQAPTPTEVELGTLKLGGGTDERRVLYAQEPDPSDAELDVPTSLRLFQPPTSEPDRYDLWRGLGLIDDSVAVGDLSSAAEATAEAEATKIIGNTLKIKTEVVVDPEGFAPDQTFEFVLGDIFHADPEVLTSPNHLRFFRSDLNGYRDFARRNFWRRKMLIVAANDGQLHFFDAGIRQLIYDPTLQRNVPLFTDGTGTELFSYMPRLAMPVVGEQFDGSAVADPGVSGAHVYSLDGHTRLADAYIDPQHNGTNPRAEDREWRSVLIGGLRAGGDVMGGGTVPGFVSGYYALDITQPDKMETPAPSPQDPDPKPYPIPVGGIVPSCLDLAPGGGLQSSPDCSVDAGNPKAFPAELWSFTDQHPDLDPTTRDLLFLDEDDSAFPIDPTSGLAPTPDGNGFHDLGDTWSKPLIGQIEICTGSDCDPATLPNDIENRFVAIFGGGLDSEDPDAARRGNWLYMIDIETGRAIYKRQLEGSMPAAPAALDRDQDGLLDTIYAATTAGKVYKVDLTARASGGTVPALADVTLTNASLLGSPLSGGQSITVQRITDLAWEPFAIFDTGARPVYMTPTLMFVPDIDQYAIAFGTGNRHDLWQRNGIGGRFLTLVDEDYTRNDSRRLPRVETDYAAIGADDVNTTANHLIDRTTGDRGWVLSLEPDDRVITQAFALVGVLVFTSFEPQVAEAFDEDGNPIDACARTGRSRIFVVDASSANAFTDLDQLSAASVERYIDVGDFTTSPYVDQAATKNPPPDGGATGKNADSSLDQAQIDLQDAIRRALMQYFPEDCRFNPTFSLTVNASRSDTGFVRYATIPIAMCSTEWKQQ
ncbi:MAG: hypothetical protein AAF657_20365 [Acidobacteriota bacterium]